MAWQLHNIAKNTDLLNVLYGELQLGGWQLGGCYADNYLHITNSNCFTAQTWLQCFLLFSWKLDENKILTPAMKHGHSNLALGGNAATWGFQPPNLPFPLGTGAPD